MFRHAEKPKGSRRVPNAYQRVHSRPIRTAVRVGFFISGVSWQFAGKIGERPSSFSCHPLTATCDLFLLDFLKAFSPDRSI
jgi:hypothetical protein